MKNALLLISILTASCANITEPKSNNLLIYGDSISAGMWPTYLAESLNRNLISYAIGGTTINQRNVNGGYSQLEQVTSNRLPLLGDLVIFLPGHNDAVLYDGIEHLIVYSNYLDIACWILSQSGARVYLGTPLTTTNEKRFYKNSLIDEYAKVNKSIASKYGLGVIDFNQKYHQGGTNTQDGLHQSLAGDYDLFKIAYEEIKK